MGDQEMTRAEEVAKRASELAARAEDLARHAHEAAGVDEQLAALEAELDALAAEEAALDDGEVGGREGGGGGGWPGPGGGGWPGGRGAHGGGWPGGHGAGWGGPGSTDGGPDGGPGGGGGGPGRADADPGEDRQDRERAYRDRRDEGPDFGRLGDDWAGWTGSFGDRMEALGYRLGDLISGGLDAAFHSSYADPTPGPGERPCFSDNEKIMAVAGPTPVKVESGGGNVNVRLGSAERVLVSWRTRGWSAGATDQEAVTVTDHEGTVLIRSSGGRRWRPNVVQIDIEVPVHSAVDVTTGGGSVRIAGTQSAVGAHTGGGSIHIADVEGPVSASTGGGSVHVAGRLSGESNVRTGGGTVTVLLRPGTRIDLDAQGTPAAIDVPGLRVEGFHVNGAVDGGGDGRLEIRTGGGRATVAQA